MVSNFRTITIAVHDSFRYVLNMLRMSITLRLNIVYKKCLINITAVQKILITVFIYRRNYLVMMM